MYAIKSIVFVFRWIKFEIHKIKLRFKAYSLNFDFKN